MHQIFTADVPPAVRTNAIWRCLVSLIVPLQLVNSSGSVSREAVLRRTSGARLRVPARMGNWAALQFLEFSSLSVAAPPISIFQLMCGPSQSSLTTLHLLCFFFIKSCFEYFKARLTIDCVFHVMYLSISFLSTGTLSTWH
jgi:hypothetical protein